MDNYAIDTASRFGDIPFVDFTKDLVTGVFDSLVEAHVLQMEEYSAFISSLTQDLSTYINNTADGVEFEQIAEFIENFELPSVDLNSLDIYKETLGKLEAPATTPLPAITQPGNTSQPADTNTWWGGLINALSPAVNSLVDKIEDPSDASTTDNYNTALKAVNDYNNSIISAGTAATTTIPTYKQIYDAIAALIVSNKYGLLQTMAKQGILRLVVTEGEIETKLTFSTWNRTSNGNSREVEQKTKKRIKLKRKQKNRSRSKGSLFKAKEKLKVKKRIVTVNTAKSYHRDSSGSRVNIFGRVLIKFKSDYAPLNG